MFINRSVYPDWETWRLQAFYLIEAEFLQRSTKALIKVLLGGTSHHEHIGCDIGTVTSDRQPVHFGYQFDYGCFRQLQRHSYLSCTEHCHSKNQVYLA